MKHVRDLIPDVISHLHDLRSLRTQALQIKEQMDLLLDNETSKADSLANDLRMIRAEIVQGHAALHSALSAALHSQLLCTLLPHCTLLPTGTLHNHAALSRVECGSWLKARSPNGCPSVLSS